MSTELKVPEMGESVSEIVIGKWYKSEGDQVEQDEQLVELESEKATLDLRAPADGVLGKILKNTGDTAEVGEVIGHIGDGAAKKNPPHVAESLRDPKSTPSHYQKSAAKTSAQSPPPPTAKESPAPAKPQAKTPPEQAQKPAESAPSKPAKADKPDKPSKSEPREPVAAEPVRDEERVPMSPVRRRIASRLVEAQQNAALLTTFNEIDMSAVKALRAEYGEAFERRHKVRLGFMSFFVKVAVDALRDCPELNATIDGDEIVYRRYYDIGVAISSEKGLVVPVLRNADRMSFAQIELAIEDFANRAKGGSLKVEDLQGGTFTITNGGVFGSLLSTPIVNPPQSGVLGMHAIQNRPVVVEGQIVARPMMYVALTYDHRIVDGREAVTFLRRIKETIEAPARLLIEV